MISISLVLAMLFAVSAFAATSGTKASITASLATKSAGNYERVALSVSRSDATKVQGTIGVYTSGGSLVTSYTPKVSSSSSATFYFYVPWTSISSGYYAKGVTSAYVLKWITGYSPTISL